MMLKPVQLIGVFALLLAVGLFTSGCNNLKYTLGGTIPAERIDARVLVDGDDDDFDGGPEKANFGGVVDACACPFDWFTWPGCIESNIVYHDMNSESYPGLRLKIKVTNAYQCYDEDGDGWDAEVCSKCADIAANRCADGVVFNVAAKIKFRSQDQKDYPNARGNKLKKQTGIVCLTDNGEGANAEAPDYVAIQLNDEGYLEGKIPYWAYSNCGAVSGNVQEHDCDYYEDGVW
jgi:hypothetical protein